MLFLMSGGFTIGRDGTKKTVIVASEEDDLLDIWLSLSSIND